jgi:hypothetical protein
MTKLQYLLSLFLFFNLLACSEKRANTESADLQFDLERIDSLDLDILGAPVLASTNESKNVVFYDFPSQEILITDKAGEIQHRFSKQGDTRPIPTDS